MTLLGNLFSKKKQSESVILIDINADGVSGAYARYATDTAPTILYTRALPFEVRANEPHERAMLRALGLIGNALLTEGAPALQRATGSGRADMILLSINSPWQETTVHNEHFEEKEDFVFTKAMVNKRMEEHRKENAEKRALIDESIIGTTVNGYETQNPYGKRAHRASVTILSSLIEREVAHRILATVEELFHTKKIFPIAGNSLRYQATDDLFPHDHEGIIIDATSRSVTAVALLRKGILSNMTDTDTSSGNDAWITSITATLGDIAKRYPLPRTIFLIAREADAEEFHKKLCSAHSMGLWLSDTPPKIVPVLNATLTEAVHTTGTGTPDVVLLLMAYYYQKRRFAPTREVSA